MKTLPHNVWFWAAAAAAAFVVLVACQWHERRAAAKRPGPCWLCGSDNGRHARGCRVDSTRRRL